MNKLVTIEKLSKIVNHFNCKLSELASALKEKFGMKVTQEKDIDGYVIFLIVDEAKFHMFMLQFPECIRTIKISYEN